GLAPTQLQAFPPDGNPAGAGSRPPAVQPSNPPALPVYAGGGDPGLPAPGFQRPEKPDPTTPYHVTRAQGPWMICVHSYTGYKAPDAARRELDRIKRLPPPDPKRVKAQHEMYIMGSGRPTGEWLPVNPLTRAFVVPNPAVPQERPADWDKLDLAVLQRLNEN